MRIGLNISKLVWILELLLLELLRFMMLYYFSTQLLVHLRLL